jgi:hypothetical protein
VAASAALVGSLLTVTPLTAEADPAGQSFTIRTAAAFDVSPPLRELAKKSGVPSVRRSRPSGPSVARPLPATGTRRTARCSPVTPDAGCRRIRWSRSRRR